MEQNIVLNENLIAWVGCRVWKSRVTLGLAIKNCWPFAFRDESNWSFMLHPTGYVLSQGAGDVAFRVEWLGVSIYLRMTV